MTLYPLIITSTHTLNCIFWDLIFFRQWKCSLILSPMFCHVRERETPVLTTGARLQFRWQQMMSNRHFHFKRLYLHIFLLFNGSVFFSRSWDPRWLAHTDNLNRWWDSFYFLVVVSCTRLESWDHQYIGHTGAQSCHHHLCPVRIVALLELNPVRKDSCKNMFQGLPCVIRWSRQYRSQDK